MAEARRQQRIAILTPTRRVGRVIEERDALAAAGTPVHEHRVKFDAGGSEWFILSAVPHELLDDILDSDVIECGVGAKWERVDLRCQISQQPLIDPARGKQCCHAANVNFDSLAEYVSRYKQCPIFGCHQVIKLSLIHI